MATFEELGGFDGFNDILGPPSGEDLALMLLARRYDVEKGVKPEQSDWPRFFCAWNENAYLPPQITTPQYGNAVALGIKTNGNNTPEYFPLGYHTPVKTAGEETAEDPDSTFVIFPDLFDTDEEIAVVREIAIAKRREAIARFAFEEGKKDAVRWDYSHDSIRELHTNHHEFLDRYDVIREVIARHNDRQSGACHPQRYESDRYTQGAICWEYEQRGAQITYKKVLLRAVGLIAIDKETSMTKRVVEPRVFWVATPDPHEPTEFMQAEGMLGRSYSYDADDLGELALQVSALRNELCAGEYPVQFDMHHLAIACHPVLW